MLIGTACGLLTVKHCDHCQKSIYDFTNANQNEFLIILAENNNNICGRFIPTQITSQNPHLSIWKKLLAAAVFLLSISIFNNKAMAQTKTNDTVKEKKAVDQNAVFGGPETVVNFPGGGYAFNKFITANLRYTDGMKNGKVIVAFLIKKDGTLTNYKVIKGLGEINDNEALRVLKLSPKWNPPIQAGKYIEVEYAQVVTFDKGNN